MIRLFTAFTATCAAAYRINSDSANCMRQVPAQSLRRLVSRSFIRCYPEIQRMGTRVMSTINECIMFTVLTSGFDSNGGGNIMRERTCANTGTWAVLIKRLKKAMCAFAWRNPCDVDFSIRLTEVTPTRVRVTVTVSLTETGTVARLAVIARLQTRFMRLCISCFCIDR